MKINIQKSFRKRRLITFFLRSSPIKIQLLIRRKLDESRKDFIVFDKDLLGNIKRQVT